MAVLYRIEGDATRELSVKGSVVAAVIDLASTVAIFGSFHIHADIFIEYLGTGYRQKPIDYPSLSRVC